MIRFGLAVLLILAAAACGDELPEGPGRPMYPQAPLCQWKTPCPQAEVQPAAADGGAPDGGALPR